MSLLCKVKDDLIGTIRGEKKKLLMQVSEFIPGALKSGSGLDLWERLCTTFQPFPGVSARVDRTAEESRR